MIETVKQPFGFAMLLNANYADGIDTSWIWDGNFEELRCQSKGRQLFGRRRTLRTSVYAFTVAGVPEKALVSKPALDDVISTLKRSRKINFTFWPPIQQCCNYARN